MSCDVHRIAQGGHGFARLRTGRANGGRVLTGHFRLIVHRIVRIATQRAERRPKSFQTVRPAHYGGDGPAVQRLGQRVSNRIRLEKEKQRKRLENHKTNNVVRVNITLHYHIRVTSDFYQLSVPSGGFGMRSGGDAAEQ